MEQIQSYFKTYLLQEEVGMSFSDLKMTHVSADPSFTFYAEYGTAEMETTDHLTGATIHLRGQLGKPTFLGKKLREIIQLLIHKVTVCIYETGKWEEIQMLPSCIVSHS